jgi:hypothetical protein
MLQKAKIYMLRLISAVGQQRLPSFLILSKNKTIQGLLDYVWYFERLRGAKWCKE